LKRIELAIIDFDALREWDSDWLWRLWLCYGAYYLRTLYIYRVLQSFKISIVNIQHDKNSYLLFR
jgi:hypothetical protein